METIIGVLVGGFLAFNAFVTPGRAAKQAESALRKKFPGATVKVDIEGKRGRSVLKGNFKKVTVEMSDLQIADFPIQSNAQTPNPSSIGHLELSLHNLAFGKLRVKSAQLSFNDVRYDFGALKKRSEIGLVSFSNGKIALAIEAPALIPTVMERAPTIEEPHVGLSGGELILTGKQAVLGARASVLVQGPIVARGQNLEIDNARVEVAKLRLSPVLAAPLLKTVNPLYTFDEKWPFNVQDDHIVAENDELQIEGTLTAK